MDVMEGSARPVAMNHALRIHAQRRATQDAPRENVPRQIVMLTRGKLIVLAILLLAVGLAVVNMIVQTRASGRAVAHWGPAAASLILTASHVELLELSAARQTDEPNVPPRPAPDQESLQIGSDRLVVVQRVDASRAPGILHARRALVADNLFDWEATPAEPTWRYAMRYREGDSTFTLLFDEACLVSAAQDSPDRLLALRADGGESPMRSFIREQFPEGAAPVGSR
jgi:hypothetical protein